MLRWYFILLLLCLILKDQRNFNEEAFCGVESEAVPVFTKHALLKNEDLLRQDLAGLSITPSQPFPGSLPWLPLHEIGTKGIDFLIQYHPPLFLEMCLERYKQEVKGYSAKLLKHEVVAGKLQHQEIIEIHFREQPFSVYMNWLEGGVGLIPPQKVLYVKGENNDKLLARGRGLAAYAGVFEKDIHSDEVKKTGRYTIDNFGINLGTERSLESMRLAQQGKKLHIEYKGLTKVPQLNERLCYMFVRTPYEPPEEVEGLNEYTIYIDRENWLQVGSVLKDAEGKFIASYFFSDLKINPEFKKDQFTKAGM